MGNKTQHIMICPLDWGLGHASRCIPIINELLRVGCRITIAGNGRSLSLLKNEFPNLQHIDIEGFSPKYSKYIPLLLQLFIQLPAFILSIIYDKRRIKKLMANHRFDCIISDNRYGLRHKDAKSILLTHQVMIKMPVWLKLFEYPFYLISRLLISRFDECWIPDFRDSPGLSGDLSHKYPLPKNSKFIGPLSRFNYPIKLPESCGSSIVVLISGPEPQRSIFEKIILKQLQLIDKPAIVVCGNPEGAGEFKKMKNITLYPHLDTPTLEGLISTAEAVICRSGYSSLMDLYKLGSKALLIPTPGQTEQIYLAELHQNLHNFISRNQSELFLPEDIKHLIQCKRMSSATTEEDLLKHAIARLVNNK